MLDAAIVLLSFYAVTWVIQNSELLSTPRNYIMRNSVFMFKLLSCSFCTGFYSGLFVYLLHEEHWSLRLLLLWGLASSSLCYILNAVVNRLSVGEIN